MLEINTLSFSYHSKKILDNLSLKIKKGTTSTIIGSSGSGKTTLLKIVAGLIRPKSGSVTVHGELSYMMQEDMLLPWRDVMGNLSLISELKPTSDPNWHGHARELLHVVGLEGHEHKLPHELSGGMRKRVSLAQAILHRHPLLLLDEPFSSLDVILREKLFKLLQKIQKNYGTTILMVTHDYRDAVSLSDQIILLKDYSIHSQWEITKSIRNSPSETGILIDLIRQASGSDDNVAASLMV